MRDKSKYRPLYYKDVKLGTVIFVSGSQQYGIISKLQEFDSKNPYDKRKMLEITWLTESFYAKAKRYRETIYPHLNKNTDLKLVNWFFVGRDFKATTARILYG